VAVRVVDVVRVIAVGDGLVPTIGTMDVVVVVVNDVGVDGALVPMALVAMVGVTVVQVVGVIAVGDGNVPALVAVDVIVFGVGLVGCGHSRVSAPVVSLVRLRDERGMAGRPARCRG
jgi:hypothetical protein